MNKSIFDGFNRLFKFLDHFGLPTISQAHLKGIIRNNSQYLPATLETLFSYIYYVNHGAIDPSVYKDLQKEFDIDSITSFLYEELKLLGYKCRDDQFSQPMDIFLAIAYLIARFVIEKIIRVTLFESSSVLIPLGTDARSMVQSREECCDDVDEWVLQRHRVDGLCKQIDTLSGSVVSKERRLRACCPSIEPEILYLLKNRSLLLKFEDGLRRENELVEALVDMVEQEADLWRWLSDQRREEMREDRSRGEASLDKLRGLGALSTILDTLWIEATRTMQQHAAGAAALVERAAGANLAVVLGHLSSRVALAPPPSAAGGRDCPYRPADAKAHHLTRQFEAKFEHKMKGLARYTDALILDGST